MESHNEGQAAEAKACALCGYTKERKFEGDVCPQCGEKCNFLNISCYTPECGGPGHFDPRL